MTADLATLAAARARLEDATDTVDALTHRGLIERSGLTDDGRTLLDRLQREIVTASAPIWADLDEDDVAATERVLEAVIARTDLLLRGWCASVRSLGQASRRRRPILSGITRHGGGARMRTMENIVAVQERLGGHWQPARLASLNDHDVKVVSLLGEFVWHTHPDTDELFLVRSGHLTIQLRDGDVGLGPDDVFVVPAGVEHCPRADEEVVVLLVERQGTINTGDAAGDRTFLVEDG